VNTAGTIPLTAIAEETKKLHAVSDRLNKKKALVWSNYLVLNKPEEEIPVFKIGNIIVATLGNHLLIIGKKKSRKTLFLVWLITEYLKNGGKKEDILICDTEQGVNHVWKIREKVKTISGLDIDILALRGLSPEERKEVIKQAIVERTYKIVFIDGIRDLLNNINDPDQVTTLLTWAEALIVTHKILIVNVLHQNKTDNNARGHLGTELLNKAQTTIELELKADENCTLVKCESSRDIPFESFAFTHDSTGLPELVTAPTKGGSALNETEQKARLKFVFEDNQLRYQELIDQIKIHYEVGNNKATQLKASFERNGWIVKSGKERSADTVYKLMIN
jgi:hypothetical protein